MDVFMHETAVHGTVVFRPLIFNVDQRPLAAAKGEKTGFTEEDADILKECLRTLFVNDASSARPEGSMELIKLYWFRHNCKDGQYSSAKVHRSVQANPVFPASWTLMEPLIL